MRWLRACGTAVGVAVLLTGCITLKSQTTSLRVAGVISLYLAVCATGDDRSAYGDRDSTAPDRNTEESRNSGEANFDGLGQLLVGFRVPVGTVASTSFPGATQDVFFNRSPHIRQRSTNVRPPPGRSLVRVHLDIEALRPQDAVRAADQLPT